MTFPTRRREACCLRIERASISIDPNEVAGRIRSKCQKKVERKESSFFITNRKLVVREKVWKERDPQDSAMGAHEKRSAGNRQSTELFCAASSPTLSTV